MGLRGFRESCAVATLAVLLPVTMLGASQAWADASADEDRPCVPPSKHSKHSKHAKHSKGSKHTRTARPLVNYAAEQPAPAAPVHVPIEITPSAGYTFSTGVPVVGGLLVFAPSPVFGATVDVGEWYGIRLEADYKLQLAGLELDTGSGSNTPQYTVTAHHFQLGAELDLLRHGVVRPFLGLLAGAVWFSPQSNVQDELWFEGSIAAGAKVLISRHWGIRAQATVTAVTMDSRSQVFCPSGCYTEWYGIGMSQIALTAGPMLRF
ncbi:MAG TPA: hypothetical protein VF765_18100 [Polyangiaceae bacterium]